MADPVFHLARRADWLAAQGAGRYEVSTIGATLAEVGYIHLSRGDQVAGVAERFYAGVDDLVLLEVDTDRAGAPLRWDPVGDDVYPHLYGPLPVDAVTAVTTWR